MGKAVWAARRDESSAARKSSTPQAICVKRALAVAALVCVVALPLAWLATDQGRGLLEFLSDGERVQAWVDQRGSLASVAMVGAVMLQIVVAVLPGEPVELAAGYAFGALEGTVLCLLGGALGRLAVVALVRTLGFRVIDLFFPREKVVSLKWLQDSERFELALFACFLIPGSPKDILTYVAGLADCPARRIVAITTVGSVPSVVSSTLAAGFAAQGDWLAAAITMVVTFALVLAGAGAYAALRRHAR